MAATNPHDLREGRELTELGLEQHQQTVQSFTKKLLKYKVKLKKICDYIWQEPVQLKELFGNLNRTYAKFENYLQLSRTCDTEAEITRWKSVVNTVKGQIQHVTS